MLVNSVILTIKLYYKLLTFSRFSVTVSGKLRQRKGEIPGLQAQTVFEIIGLNIQALIIDDVFRKQAVAPPAVRQSRIDLSLFSYRNRMRKLNKINRRGTSVLYIENNPTDFYNTPAHYQYMSRAYFLYQLFSCVYACLYIVSFASVKEQISADL